MKGKLAGYDLTSGRLRDVIAAILNKSTTKIAQIERITGHLIPFWVAGVKKYFIHSHSFIPSKRVQEHIDSDLAPYDVWIAKKLVTVTETILDMVKQFDPKAPAGEGVGLGLGSQVSQVLAPAIPGAMDHFVKEVLGVKYYGRYMDDFYLIHPDKEFLKTCMDAIRAKCAEVGLTLSDRKTQIVKLTRGFTFLKVRTHVTEGQVFPVTGKREIEGVVWYRVEDRHGKECLISGAVVRYMAG